MAEVHRITGSIGGHTKWSRVSDRKAATQAMRDGFMARFYREVDPDGTLPPLEREKRAEAAKSAYFQRLVLARWKKRHKAGRGAGTRTRGL